MPQSAAELGEEIEDLLVERIRAGLWISVVSMTLFALADLVLNPLALADVYQVKLLQGVTVVVAFWLLRRPVGRRHVVTLALVTATVICLTTAASGIVTRTPSTTALLLVVFAMGTATLLPWGVGPQIAIQLVAGFSIVWNAAAVPGSGVFDYLMVAVIVGSIAAIYSAYTQDHYRRERRRAAEMLEETLARRHDADLAHAARLSTLGEMAAGLAHELNQPLSAIVSYARGCALRLRAGEVENEALIEVIEEISEQALRAGEVLRRIREFVRHGELKRERLDPNELVREAIRFAELEARPRGVTVRLELNPEAAPVEVDRIQVEQVILNLVRNGIEAMGATARGERELSITTSAGDGDAVEVAVHDTGEGVPPGIVSRLFDPFFSTKRDGLGLGLSISRSIIEAHGGRLWASTNGGRGATLRFTLPAAREVANGR